MSGGATAVTVEAEMYELIAVCKHPLKQKLDCECERYSVSKLLTFTLLCSLDVW